MIPETHIRQYMQTEIFKGLTEEVADDRPLIRDGLINSIGIMKLMTFMSDRLQVEFEDEDYRVENFETINNIMEFLKKKMATTANTAQS
jgi:acyl carrier protein